MLSRDVQPFRGSVRHGAVNPVGSAAMEGRATVEDSGPWSESVLDIYRAHWDRLVRMAALLLDDVAASEDIVQEAFVRLDLSRRDGARSRPIDSEVAFVTRIVVNLARSSLRRRLAGDRATLRLVRSGYAASLEGPGADGAVLARFERQAVVASLRKLPRRQREAVVLRYYGDLSLEDIAGVMGVSVGTAKSNLARGRDALAQLIENHRSGENQ